MLIHFRKLADNFFTKLLLLMIVASFVLWGVGDIVGGSRKVDVVQVGDTSISANEYYGQLQRIKNNLGEFFSPEIVKQLNLMELSLFELIAKKLYAQEAASMHVNAGDELIKQLITKETDFHNENGLFDPAIFTRRLQQMGISESQFVTSLKAMTAEEIMQKTLTPHMIYPEDAIKLFFIIEQQKRKMLAYTLSDAQLTTEISISAEELRTYYETHKETYNAPEYRAIEYVVLDKNAVERAIVVSEDALRASYLQRQKELMIPEKRDIWQLLYSNKADSERAYGLLREKKKPEEVVVALPPVNAEEIQLGVMAKHQLTLNADEIFALEKNNFTSPVKSDFGWHIFIVRDIQPAFTPAYADLKEQLKAELIKQEKNKTLRNLLEQLEDSVAAATPIAEIASTLSLELRTTPPIDTLGKGIDNTPVFDATQEARLLEVIFSLPEKQLSEVEQLKNGNYFVASLKEVIPARARALEEVSGLVMADAQKEKRAQALQQLSKKITQEIQQSSFTSQAEIRALLTKYGITEMEELLVARDGSIDNKKDAPVSAEMTDALFNATTPFDPLAFVQEKTGLRGGIYLEEITPDITHDKAAYNELATRIQKHSEQEILEQYVIALQKRYPVVRDMQAIESVNKQF
jgi:peptidyl-prolyl cis-trans isomerase D